MRCPHRHRLAPPETTTPATTTATTSEVLTDPLPEAVPTVSSASSTDTATTGTGGGGEEQPPQQQQQQQQPQEPAEGREQEVSAGADQQPQPPRTATAAAKGRKESEKTGIPTSRRSTSQPKAAGPSANTTKQPGANAQGKHQPYSAGQQTGANGTKQNGVRSIPSSLTSLSNKNPTTGSSVGKQTLGSTHSMQSTPSFGNGSTAAVGKPASKNISPTGVKSKAASATNIPTGAVASASANGQNTQDGKARPTVKVSSGSSKAPSRQSVSTGQNGRTPLVGVVSTAKPSDELPGTKSRPSSTRMKEAQSKPPSMASNIQSASGIASRVGSAANKPATVVRQTATKDVAAGLIAENAKLKLENEALRKDNEKELETLKGAVASVALPAEAAMAASHFGVKDLGSGKGENV
ncbi:hypothetical protein DFJ73DRAFT_372270 [Zopfochytrium polystomum]|nr:hypothetical protein DFJ73DRAFT_372270 [Zopfochytrium polystomum]